MEHGRIKSVETAGPAKIAAFDTKKRGREEAGADSCTGHDVLSMIDFSRSAQRQNVLHCVTKRSVV